MQNSMHQLSNTSSIVCMYVCIYVCMYVCIYECMYDCFAPGQFLEIIESVQYGKLDVQWYELLGEQIALEVNKEFA